MNLSDTIIPRSDQLNAEDLLSGPRTVTIKDVHKGASAEQPVDIVLDEFGPTRPFKPSKTVRRILVAAWGVEASAYVGRRMTIYRDPAVKFGGMDVGGIRISHLSDIDKPLSLALTVTRGKRAPYVVKPLTETAPKPPQQPAAADRISGDQLARLKAHYADTPPAVRLGEAGDILGRDVDSFSTLTRDEASRVIAYIDGPTT